MTVQRRHLPHDIPLGVDPAREVYYLTLSCQPRGRNSLAREEVAQNLFASAAHLEQTGCWCCFLMLLMPDHLHGLVRFASSLHPMREVISNWKRWTSRWCQIPWQRDFFEHRLRREESLRDKATYILENPVRAKLVARVEDWPFVHFGSQYAIIRGS